MHLDDELHARVRLHCQDANVPMKEWVGQVLTAALETGTPIELELAPAATRVPVAKKRLPQCDDEETDELWSRPPFWAKL